MKSRVSALVMLVLMLLAAGGAYGLRPTQKIADTTPSVDPEVMIPTAFGDWREELRSTPQIVDPQQQQTIDKIYSKTLSRTYVNSEGYRIMLSVAYGSNQSDSMQVHKPEVCYPAQGFSLHAKQTAVLRTSSGDVPVTRLETSLGARREPVTYWVTVGDRVISSRMHKKFVEMSYGFGGEIPDGMLLRLSSIDAGTAHAYDVQVQFAEDLLSAVRPEHRTQLFGLK
ncbi:exosortase-associated protein EpsI, B-type [Azoarcus sp. CIB]|uniref:exosortase-associated protein EpsI, B-type n=1 Tax=Aromatoleum sp. (strain CIB) TaxID=198107 RepID=UPI00067B1BB6|nr:exosortase-associated protein EpsI, B-type [Azoarcus sp. CIB]